MPRILCALLLAATLAGCGSRSVDLEFGEALRDYPAVKATVVKLPDGGRLAFGSVDGHDVTVQWRDPDGSSWSAPVEVHRDPKMYTHDIHRDRAGMTVAIGADYWVQKHLDDDYAPDGGILVMCHDYTCEKGVPSGGIELDGRGEYGVVGSPDRRVRQWTKGAGFGPVAHLTGIPSGVPLGMLPTGALVAFVGRHDGDFCRYDMFVTEPRKLAFRLATKGTRSPGDGCSGIGSDEIVGAGHVRIFLESLQDSVDYRLGDKGWYVDAPKVPLMQIKDTHGRTTITPRQSRLPDGTQVAIGSRDTRTLIAQYRAPGEKSWSEPATVATAPRGTTCHLVEEADDALFVVQCYDLAVEYDWNLTQDAAVALVLASRDGRQWERQELAHPLAGMNLQQGHFIVPGRDRTLVYDMKSLTHQVVRLPLQARSDSVSLSPDARSLVLLAGNAAPGARCTITYAVAPLTATSWPPRRALPGVDPNVVGHRGWCAASSYPDGDVYDVTFTRQDYSINAPYQLKAGKLSPWDSPYD